MFRIFHPCHLASFGATFSCLAFSCSAFSVSPLAVYMHERQSLKVAHLKSMYTLISRLDKPLRHLFTTKLSRQQCVKLIQVIFMNHECTTWTHQ